MANTDSAYGFAPKGHILRINPKDVLASYATAIFKGDFVSAEAGGDVNASIADDVTKLGASMMYSAASTVAQASDGTALMVSDHPDQLYEAQDDGSAVPTMAIVGSAADNTIGAGSTTTLRSGHEIALSDLGQTDGGFVILRAVDREDNDKTAVNCDWVVQLNAGEGLLTLAASV
jgi:hypothetical protein|tara:strand:+ start:1967 stop:2491 length:525 start_codon:yes stop_codon:yes gene_type:complete